MTLPLPVDLGLIIIAGKLWSAHPLRVLFCPGIVLCCHVSFISNNRNMTVFSVSDTL